MVYFIGAGPGDVDLITVKGRKLLQEADVVVYAGSLVSTEHLNFCKENVEVYDSSSMSLEEITQVVHNAYSQGKRVVRLHTGDPTIYGAILEQMRELDKLNIPYEVVPGVSSFTASCARIKREFTVPDVTQTVILTRISGRTYVPEEEDLEGLAAHKSSMAIFLSVHDIDRVVEKLKRGYRDENVPCAVVYKATWQDEEVIIGTLKDIAEKVKEKNIKKTAQILVGYFLDDCGTYSKLYDKKFSHEFRDAL